MFGCLLFRSVYTYMFMSTLMSFSREKPNSVLDFDSYFWKWVKVLPNQNVRVFSIFYILTLLVLQNFNNVIPFSPLKFCYVSSTGEGLKSKTMLA